MGRWWGPLQALDDFNVALRDARTTPLIQITPELKVVKHDPYAMRHPARSIHDKDMHDIVTYGDPEITLRISGKVLLAAVPVAPFEPVLKPSS
jgi:hypothetical protein